MVRKLYLHPRSIEAAAKIAVKRLGKYLEDGMTFDNLPDKKKARIEKIIKLMLKKAERVAVTRPPM